jgi:hypothetical protein
MTAQFLNANNLRMVKPLIVNPANHLIIPIMNGGSEEDFFIGSSDLRQEGRCGILPDGRLIRVDRFNHLFPYNPLEVSISRKRIAEDMNNLTVKDRIRIEKYNPVVLKPYQLQNLRVNGYPHIYMTIAPLGVACFPKLQDVDELIKNLKHFELISRHDVEFDCESFVEHATAVFLHLQREKFQSDSRNVGVIQVRLHQRYKPALSASDPNGEFTWEKLLEIFTQLGLSYCPNEFLIQCFLATMPLGLECGDLQEPFEVMQPLATKAHYIQEEDRKMVMGFRWSFSPIGYNRDLPKTTLEGVECLLTDPVFPKNLEEGELSVWMTLPS